MRKVDIFSVEALRIERDGGDVVVSVEMHTLRVPIFREPIFNVDVRRISATEIRQAVADAEARVAMTRSVFASANERS